MSTTTQQALSLRALLLSMWSTFYQSLTLITVAEDETTNGSIGFSLSKGKLNAWLWSRTEPNKND